MLYLRYALYTFLLCTSMSATASLDELYQCLNRIIRQSEEKLSEKESWVIARTQKNAFKVKLKRATTQIKSVLSKNWQDVTEEEIESLRNLVRISGTVHQRHPEIVQKVIRKLKLIRSKKEAVQSLFQYSPNALKDLRKIESAAKKALKKNLLPKLYQNPNLGKTKTIIPKRFRFIHFRTPSGYYIAAYVYDSAHSKITFHMIAPHENFYEIFLRRFGL